MKGTFIMNKSAINNFFNNPISNEISIKFKQSVNPLRYIKNSYEFENASEEVQKSIRWLNLIARATNQAPSVVISVTTVDDTYYIFSEIEEKYVFRNCDMKEVESEDELINYVLQLLKEADSSEVEELIEYN